MNWKLLNVDVGQSLPYSTSKKNWLSAAIGAIGSIAGAVTGASMTNSANQGLDQANRDWQEKMWHVNNEYNTPANQRKRLEEAGINPALAFQNGNSGVASSAPTPNQHTPADWSAVGTGISQGAQFMLQASQVRSQNELLKSQAEAQQLHNQNILREDIARIDALIAQKEERGENADFLRWQKTRSMALYDAESKKMYHETMEIDARTRQENASAYLMEIDSRLRHLQNVVGVQFTQAQINHLKADINRIVEETGYLTERKLYQILDNARMLPDVKRALRLSERMDNNPNETEILDALGIWLDPVSQSIDAGSKVYNARTGRKGLARSRVKRERKYDGTGNYVMTEYDYE